MWDRKARVERGAVFLTLVEHEAGRVCGGLVEVIIEEAALLARRRDEREECGFNLFFFAGPRANERARGDLFVPSRLYWLMPSCVRMKA